MCEVEIQSLFYLSFFSFFSCCLSLESGFNSNRGMSGYHHHHHFQGYGVLFFLPALRHVPQVRYHGSIKYRIDVHPSILGASVCHALPRFGQDELHTYFLQHQKRREKDASRPSLYLFGHDAATSYRMLLLCRFLLACLLPLCCRCYSGEESRSHGVTESRKRATRCCQDLYLP